MLANSELSLNIRLSLETQQASKVQYFKEGWQDFPYFTIVPIWYTYLDSRLKKIVTLEEVQKNAIITSSELNYN